MSTDLSALLEELEQARAKATPGPWKHEHDDYGDEWWFGGNTDGGQETVNGVLVTDADHATDAALIVAAVNALPQLTAALRRVERLADEYESDGRKREAAYRSAWPLNVADRLRDALNGEPS